MKTRTLTLPEHWASYLFYGDATGLDGNDVEDIDRLLQHYKVGSVLSVSEHCEFANFHDAWQWGFLPCTCLDYTFPDLETAS